VPEQVVQPETTKFLKELAKLPEEKVAELPEADFDSIVNRLNALSVSSYDEKVKIRALDIMARLRLARAKTDLPATTPVNETADHNLDRLSGPEFALYGYLLDKIQGHDLSDYTNPGAPLWVRDAVAVLTSLGLEP